MKEFGSLSLVLVSVCNIGGEERRKDMQIFASQQLHCLILGWKLASLYLFIYQLCPEGVTRKCRGLI
jgi:hypothetical protein